MDKSKSIELEVATYRLGYIKAVMDLVELLKSDVKTVDLEKILEMQNEASEAYEKSLSK